MWEKCHGNIFYGVSYMYHYACSTDEWVLQEYLEILKLSLEERVYFFKGSRVITMVHSGHCTSREWWMWGYSTRLIGCWLWIVCDKMWNILEVLRFQRNDITSHSWENWWRHIYSRFASNSEADALELVANPE